MLTYTLFYTIINKHCFYCCAGTGYFQPTFKAANEFGWKTIADQVVNSATDTETVDAILRSLLPEERYFRFNPRCVRSFFGSLLFVVECTLDEPSYLSEVLLCERTARLVRAAALSCASTQSTALQCTN
jgi:hypothetical protein